MKIKRTNVMVASAAFIVLYKLLKDKRRAGNKEKLKKRRRTVKIRNDYEAPDLLMSSTPAPFDAFVRMSASDFELLIQKIGPKISKMNTNFREAIRVEDRLGVTLRFLATGESYTSLSSFFKFSKQIISRIIPEVCKALIDGLKEQIKMPSSADEWKAISNQFSESCNFPHCIGALDGKHILLTAPIKSGADFSAGKLGFLIALIAIVDANYRFIYADVSCHNENSDQVLKSTPFYESLLKKNLHLPDAEALWEIGKAAPYFFVASDGFPLMDNIMKPFPRSEILNEGERSFNCRLGKIRRIAENVFGLMSMVFRVLRHPVLLQAETAQVVALSCLYLHNFLKSSESSADLYAPKGTFDDEGYEGVIVEGTWRKEAQNTTSFLLLPKVEEDDGDGEEFRKMFAEYCSPWKMLTCN